MSLGVGVGGYCCSRISILRRLVCTGDSPDGRERATESWPSRYWPQLPLPLTNSFPRAQAIRTTRLYLFSCDASDVTSIAPLVPLLRKAGAVRNVREVSAQDQGRLLPRENAGKILLGGLIVGAPVGLDGLGCVVRGRCGAGRQGGRERREGSELRTNTSSHGKLAIRKKQGGGGGGCRAVGSIVSQGLATPLTGKLKFQVEICREVGRRHV